MMETVSRTLNHSRTLWPAHHMLPRKATGPSADPCPCRPHRGPQGPQGPPGGGGTLGVGSVPKPRPPLKSPALLFSRCLCSVSSHPPSAGLGSVQGRLGHQGLVVSEVSRGGGSTPEAGDALERFQARKGHRCLPRGPWVGEANVRASGQEETGAVQPSCPKAGPRSVPASTPMALSIAQHAT